MLGMLGSPLTCFYSSTGFIIESTLAGMDPDHRRVEICLTFFSYFYFLTFIFTDMKYLFCDAEVFWVKKKRTGSIILLKIIKLESTTLLKMI